LKPNDVGMFDMQGNGMEWCYDGAVPYSVSTDGSPVEDLPDLSEVQDGRVRVLRGGGFSVRPRNVRSASRYRYLPPDRDVYFGMRAARTYP